MLNAFEKWCVSFAVQCIWEKPEKKKSVSAWFLYGLRAEMVGFFYLFIFFFEELQNVIYFILENK